MPAVSKAQFRRMEWLHGQGKISDEKLKEWTHGVDYEHLPERVTQQRKAKADSNTWPLKRRKRK